VPSRLIRTNAASAVPWAGWEPTIGNQSRGAILRIGKGSSIGPEARSQPRIARTFRQPSRRASAPAAAEIKRTGPGLSGVRPPPSLAQMRCRRQSFNCGLAARPWRWPPRSFKGDFRSPAEMAVGRHILVEAPPRPGKGAQAKLSMMAPGRRSKCSWTRAVDPRRPACQCRRPPPSPFASPFPPSCHQDCWSAWPARWHKMSCTSRPSGQGLAATRLWHPWRAAYAAERST